MVTNENLTMCAECGGRCCKRYAGAYKYSELGKDYRARLGKDLVVGVKILLNPSVALPMIQQSVAYQDPSVLKDAFNDLDIWDKFFKGSNSISEAVFFVKPKQEKDKYHIVTERAFEKLGACVNLGSNGCKLPYEERPLGCKSLVPCFTNGVDRCTNDIDNLDLVVVRSWNREREFLKNYVVTYISENEQIQKDKIYVDNIIEPLKEMGYLTGRCVK